MTNQQPEVADVVRTFGSAFLRTHSASLPMSHRRVLRDLAACRTAALGGHRAECNECGHRQIAYNSCRNRHCPKCQGAARIAWTAQREAELLPVPYLHVVFTLPSELAPFALQNKRVVYGLLFQAAAETLQELAADPRHLGARLGFLAVLHTWGQNLMHHPHVHCIVPAGGLSPDARRWVDCRRSQSTGRLFFLPVRVLSRVFRGKFIQHLKRACADGLLSFHGRLMDLANSSEFERLLNSAVRQDWVVYAKHPFGGPKQVLRYLARYTHRVAISNRRLIEIGSHWVRFQWKDYADAGAKKIMTLDGLEFLRRFLLHTLPGGFRRIRYYGFLSNRHRKDNLELCRRLLGTDSGPRQWVGADPPETSQTDVVRCPVCRTGRMVLFDLVPSQPFRELTSPYFLQGSRQKPIMADTS